MMTFLRFILLAVSAVSSGLILGILLLMVLVALAPSLQLHHPQDAIFLPFISGIAIMAVFSIMGASSFGDRLAELFFSVRKQSFREEQITVPALKEAQKAYEEKHSQKLDIRILAMDLPNIHGIALGNKTIAVSTGLLKTAKEEELTAMLSHEIGHLHHGDGSFNMAMAVATSPMICAVNLIIWLFDGVTGSKTLKSVAKDAGEHGSSCLAIFKMLFAMACMVPIVISLPALILLRVFNFLTNWTLEYRADKFAGDLGYAHGLISLFERIEDEDVRGAEGFMKKYIYSHPPTALRIDRLERMMGIDVGGVP